MRTSRGRGKEARTKQQTAACQHESVESIIPLARGQASDRGAESACEEQRHQANTTRNGGGAVDDLEVFGQLNYD